MRAQVSAIRRGLGAVVPLRALSLFSWDEVATFVCGCAEVRASNHHQLPCFVHTDWSHCGPRGCQVDVDLLYSVATYEGCSRDDRHVQLFWGVLRSFTHEERSLFLRFVWGRSRLPLTAAEFSRPFKIQRFSKPDGCEQT